MESVASKILMQKRRKPPKQILINQIKTMLVATMEVPPKQTTAAKEGRGDKGHILRLNSCKSWKQFSVETGTNILISINFSLTFHKPKNVS